MRLRILTAGLGLAVFIGRGHAAFGQVSQDTMEVRLFQLAYEAVEAKHRPPRGERVLTLNDPLLGTPQTLNAEVQRANGQYAKTKGMRSAELRDVLTCTSPDGCAFKDSIVATLSFRMESRWTDSAVVLVAVRHFPPQRPSNSPRWQSMAMYAVRLGRRSGDWIVVSLGVRAES